MWGAFPVMWLTRIVLDESPYVPMAEPFGGRCVPNLPAVRVGQ